MALFTHTGAGSTDLGALYTKREDISDLLAASLVPQPNFLGSLPIGAEVVDTRFTWLEDRLNANSITDLTGGGQTTSSTSMTVSAADGSIIGVGYILADEANAGVALGEQVQVTAVTPGSPNYTLTVSRIYGGTTATTHAQNAVWRIVNKPTYENSDLGPDMSRARLIKYNVIGRWEMNVNISQEQIDRAKAGAAPGVGNELKYQFEQRLAELIRTMNNAALYSRLSSTSTPLVGDYSTTAGLAQWTDGTWNTTAAPASNAGTFADTLINNQVAPIDRLGGLVDVMLVGVNHMLTFSRFYNDRIRLEQSERRRGFTARVFDTGVGTSVEIIKDNQVYDTSPNALFWLLNTAKLRLRPFVSALLYVITAPSFRDGDAVRALSKWGLEVRNSGSDAGAEQQLVSGVSF